VIEQIVNNACKYVDVHGKIKIQGEENDESVILTIWDNGMGIPEKDIDRILTGDLQEKTAERLQSPRAWDFISAKKWRTN